MRVVLLYNKSAQKLLLLKRKQRRFVNLFQIFLYGRIEYYGLLLTFILSLLFHHRSCVGLLQDFGPLSSNKPACNIGLILLQVYILLDIICSG
jgi:membrane protease YdiL (CAAX protease family)